MSHASRRLIIDTDPGVDDALALAAALRCGARVEAITVVSGNVPLEVSEANALRLLGIAGGPDRPIVARGAQGPLVYPPAGASDLHGADGLGGIAGSYAPDGGVGMRTAWEEISARLEAEPGTIDLLAIGPSTNLARAEIERPGCLRMARRITLMAGAFRVPGNVTPVAEFNAYVDPHALAIVLEAGATLALVPLDITRQVLLTRADVEERVERNPSPLLRFVDAATRFTMEQHRLRGEYHGLHPHDAIALGAVLWPELFAFERNSVQVEVESPLCRGLTVADFRPHRRGPGPGNAEIALGVQAGPFLEKFWATVSDAPGAISP